MVDEGSPRNWLPDVILAFREAGGTARFPQVYRWIRMNRKQLPGEWEATIRATVYRNSSDSPAFEQGNPDVFLKKGHGVWALRHPSETVSGKKRINLFADVIEDMSKEQIQAFSGRADEFWEYVKQQVEEKKRKFKFE